MPKIDKNEDAEDRKKVNAELRKMMKDGEFAKLTCESCGAHIGYAELAEAPAAYCPRHGKAIARGRVESREKG